MRLSIYGVRKIQNFLKEASVKSVHTETFGGFAAWCGSTSFLRLHNSLHDNLKKICSKSYFVLHHAYTNIVNIYCDKCSLLYNMSVTMTSAIKEYPKWLPTELMESSKQSSESVFTTQLSLEPKHEMETVSSAYCLKLPLPFHKMYLKN